MQATEFNHLYKSLNPAQKQAVDTIEGPVVVIAGPGTGKTTVLTLRIANILKRTDVAPENILALTFTESGANAMRRKLTEIIGPSAYKVNIHTFHGFAGRIIEKYPDYFPRIIGSAIITEAEKIKIIEQIIKSKKIKLLRPYGDNSYYVAPILREIQILKRENISPAKLKSSLSGLSVSRDRDGYFAEPTLAERDEGSAKRTYPSRSRYPNSPAEEARLEKQRQKNIELAYVYNEYEKELAENKYYDFEDMLLELIRAMEADTSFKLMLQEEYQYILADEHQDANAAQNRILELLSDFHQSPNLFIVGDDKQAIYRFQGASLDNFLYFSEKYKDAIVIDLEHNYRSHQGILDASHSLISHNPTIPGRDRKKLVSLQVGAMPIATVECVDRNSELKHIAELVDKMIKSGANPDEIVILYRENEQAGAVSSMLDSHFISHKIESDYDILSEPDAVKIIALCEAINDPSNSEALAKALLLPELNCDPADVMDVFSETNRTGKTLHQVIKSKPRILPKHGEPVFNPLFKAYDKIVKWNRDAQTILFPDFLHGLIQDTRMIVSILLAENTMERLETVQSLYDYAVEAARSKKNFYLRDFIEYIGIIKNHGIKSKRDTTNRPNGVRLMTAHRAKGLEFDHVFIIHAVDGVWGNRTSRNLFNIPAIEHARNIGRIEDERRLFYVAMTRARRSVNITYFRSDGARENIPSQFLSEIDPENIEFTKIESTLPPVMAFSPYYPKAGEILGNIGNIIDDENKTGATFEILGQSNDTDGVKTLDAILKGFDNFRKPTILDKDFVKEKFLSQPLSVTHLNNYLECPWRYFFVNLIRIPQAPNKHQMYGTAVHSALRVFFDAYKEGKRVSKKSLVDMFKKYMQSQPMSVMERKEAIEKGEKALSGYFDEYNGKWNKNLITEYSIRGVTFALNDLSSELSLELTGKLDKVEFLENGAIAVIDYKTGKPKSRNDIEGKTKNADGNYKRQLVFYKLLLNGQTGENQISIRQSANKSKIYKKNIPPKFFMEYGEIDFIEPNDRGKYKKEQFEVTDIEVSELEKVIAEVAGEITSLSFIDKGCGDKDCEYCKFGRLLKGGE